MKTKEEKRQKDLLRKAKNDADTQLKLQNYQLICDEKNAEGYQVVESTISIVKANVMAILIAGPIAFIAFVIFQLLNGMGRGGHVIIASTSESIGINLFMLLGGYILFLVVMLALIVIHEGLHGLGWSMFCKDGWKSIRFGVIWKYVTPYCHCKESLSFGAYLFGGLLPFLVLGVGFWIVALILGSKIVLFISLFNILAAGGDLTIALMLLKYRKAKIYDHPTACGFVAFVKE